jgi:tetratricopeptide (TPR) repeat protein
LTAAAAAVAAAAAQANFEKALVLAQSIGERVQERRAVRGLAAACKLQGRYQEAIGYYERVLLISQAMGEFTGGVLNLQSMPQGLWALVVRV